MAEKKALGKNHVDRLVELEEQMLFLVEVPDNVRFLESRLDEIAAKADTIDAVAYRLDGMPVQELMMRVETLEDKATRSGGYEHGESSSGSVARIEERVESLDSAQKEIAQMVSELSEEVRAAIGVVRAEVADLNARVNLTIQAVGNQASAGGVVQFNKVNVPEPKPFRGVRDAKALENFIFDMEQYFKATNTVSEDMKVTLATMHLADDAKLWWRSRYMDIQEGRCTIDSWELLRQELRSQFFPENVEVLARRKLRMLKHTGTIREYVKQFAGLMLDIRDMSEKDKVFNFVEGLKPSARTKLYEQKVQSLTEAYGVAERLFDLISEPTEDKPQERRESVTSPHRDSRDYRPASPRSWGGDRQGSQCGERRPSPSKSENSWQRPSHLKKPNHRSCFLCDGPHQVHECPSREIIKDFKVALETNRRLEAKAAKAVVAQAGLEESDEIPRVGAIRYMSALRYNKGLDKCRDKVSRSNVHPWSERKRYEFNPTRKWRHKQSRVPSHQGDASGYKDNWVSPKRQPSQLNADSEVPTKSKTVQQVSSQRGECLSNSYKASSSSIPLKNSFGVLAEEAEPVDASQIVQEFFDKWKKAVGTEVRWDRQTSCSHDR